MTEFRPGRFQILPPVVKNLIIINSLMVFLQFVLAQRGIDLADYLGLHYWRSSLFQPWQLFTHIFMHGSAMDINATIMHLFSNMFALWMFGSILENVWGGSRFFLFYITCGVGAALLHLGVLHVEYDAIQQAFNKYQQNATLDQFQLLLQQQFSGKVSLRAVNQVSAIVGEWSNNPSSVALSNESIAWAQRAIYGYTANGTHIDGIFDEATVGASGAVFGILFAFGYLFPNTLLYIYFLVPIKAKYVVGAYALFELFAGFRNSAGDNVAHFAHLGGMLVAFILLKIWNTHNRRKFY